MMRTISLCICIVLCSCSFDNGENIVAQASIAKLSNDTIRLSIKNFGKNPVCLSAADLSPYYGRIRIFGKNGEILRTSSVNRELQIYRGIDVADGLILVQSGKEKKVLIPLSEFAIEDGNPVKGSLHFAYAICSSLFDGGNSVKSMRVSF